MYKKSLESRTLTRYHFYSPLFNETRTPYIRSVVDSSRSEKVIAGQSKNISRGCAQLVYTNRYNYGQKAVDVIPHFTQFLLKTTSPLTGSGFLGNQLHKFSPRKSPVSAQPLITKQQSTIQVFTHYTQDLLLSLLINTLRETNKIHRGIET
jgi:hypothetical protein